MFGPNVRQALWRQNLWIGAAFAGVMSYWAFWYSWVAERSTFRLFVWCVDPVLA